MLSLDGIKAAGIEIEDRDLNIEEMFIEKENRVELIKKMRKAIMELTPRQQQIVQMIFFEGKTQEEARLYLGCAKSSMSEAISRIYASLRKKFEGK